MTMPTPHLCECGCGAVTAVATRNNTARGYVKGLSFRFIGRHHAWKGDEASYHVKHAALRLHFPKTGMCEQCGAGPVQTEYALTHGREVSRNREDYRELCLSCHHQYDCGGERHHSAKLTDAIVLDLRRRFNGGQGEYIAVLAKEHGVAQGTAWRAAVGKSWKHLNVPVV
jgi:hypothetical protein